MTPERYIGEILVRQGALSPERLEQALALAREKGVQLRDVLSSTACARREARTSRRSRASSGCRCSTKIQTDQVPAELIERVPINFARQHRLLPLAESDGVVRVAMSNLLDLSPLDDLRALLGKRCEAVAAPADVIEDAINRVYERTRRERARRDRQGRRGRRAARPHRHDRRSAGHPLGQQPLLRSGARPRVATSTSSRARTRSSSATASTASSTWSRRAHKAFLPSIIARVKIEAGPQHRREAPAAGRPHHEEDRGQAGRRPRLDHPDRARASAS